MIYASNVSMIYASNSRTYFFRGILESFQKKKKKKAVANTDGAVTPTSLKVSVNDFFFKIVIG